MFDSKFEPLMIEFSLSNSRAHLPIFSTNYPHGSHFAQMAAHFAQDTTPTPVFNSAVSRPFLDIYLHKTRPAPPKNFLFLA